MPTTLDATKVRLRFAKTGDLRLVSHHDLMRCLERMLRRAGLPMAHTQGFNPRPKYVLAQALALGIEGRREVLELELSEPIGAEEVRRRLSEVAPPGFEVLEAEAVPPGRAARPTSASYGLDGPIPAERIDPARAALSTFLAGDRWPYTRHRPDRTVELDLRPHVLGAELDPEGHLSFRLRIDPGGSARPEEVLEAVGLRDLLDVGHHLVRDEVELAERPEPAGPRPPKAAPKPPGDRPSPSTMDQRPAPEGRPPDREIASHEERDVD